MGDKIKVLFVDDDVAFGNIITLALEEAGYEAHYQTSLAGIQSVVSELQPDMIVLDVEIGAKNGLDIAPELKAIVPNTSILFVSSHWETEYVDNALAVGAVHYLRKPFDIAELLAYINRFTISFHPRGISIGIFQLDTEENLLIKNGQPAKKLSVFECKLLKLFALNRNKVVTREQIEQELWEGGCGNEQSINNYVARFRKYLSEDESVELVTIPKVGYKLSQK